MTEVQIEDAMQEEVNLKVQKRPHAFILKGDVRVPLKACVCGACGFTEFYAEDPDKLRQAYEEGAASIGL